MLPTMPTNPNVPNRSAISSLGVPLLLCCLGVGIVLFFDYVYRDNDNWFGLPSSDYRDIPPELITYKQTSVFACPVNGKPICFALLGDSIFVIGSVNPHTLSFFDEKGTLLRKVDLPEEPKTIVCGTANTIFTNKIVVTHPAQIAVYNAEGEHEFVLWKDPKMPPLGTITNKGYIIVDLRSLVLTSDYLFAADTNQCSIYRFTTEGDLDLTFDFEDFTVYASPITMTFSHADGLLYIANPGKHRVEVFTQDGVHRPELSWGEPSGNLNGFAACCNPIDVVALDDGRIVTVEKAVSRIKIFGSNGKLDGVVAGHNVLERIPPSIQNRQPLEPGGRYFSAVPLSEERIAVFDFDGQLIRIFAPLLP